jgi:GTPase SAR1 family protein
MNFSIYDAEEDTVITPRTDYTITVFGKHSVGKTTLITETIYPKQIAKNIRSTHGESCTFVKFMIRKKECRVCIRDTGDIDDMKFKWDELIQTTQCFIFCFNVNDEASFECFPEFYDNIKTVKKGLPFSILVIGCKCDKPKNLLEEFTNMVLSTSMRYLEYTGLAYSTIVPMEVKKGRCDDVLNTLGGSSKNKGGNSFFNVVLSDYIEKIEKTSIFDVSGLTDSLSLVMALGQLQ